MSLQGDPNTRPGQLGTFDVTSLMIGIIVGVGIFQTMPAVARGAGSWWATLLLWLVGGLVSLCGALGYAELASAFPRPGGDYAYLTMAYGPRAGFLFGWLQTTVVRPGDIAVMAFAFASYGLAALGRSDLDARWPACAAVAFSTATCLVGTRLGARVQNILTVAKIVGLLVLVGVALSVRGRGAVLPDLTGGDQALPLSVAMILVLFTYGGWNEAAYVAAEMRNPRRTVARALLWGTGGVLLLYLALNVVFLGSLGYAGVASSDAVAVDVVGATGASDPARLVGLLIALSALGAVNGLVFAGARITDAVAADHAVFRPLARRGGVERPPARALLWQGAMALAVILVLGSFVETVMYTAAAVYGFYLATSVAVLIMRRRGGARRGAFRMPLFPWPTVVFCGVCAFLIHGAVVYRPVIALAAAGIVLLGVPVQALSARRDRDRPQAQWLESPEDG